MAVDSCACGFRELLNCFKVSLRTNSFLSCDQQQLTLLVNWSVHKNSPRFGGHSLRSNRLKYGMEVKCVCVYGGVCLCSCQLAKRA